MAYSRKVIDKFEKTLNEPEKFNVGRFDPKEANVGTGMVGAPASVSYTHLTLPTIYSV